MPAMKREEWLKLTPRDKVAHSIQRTMDRLDTLQASYDRGRRSGKIAKPIAFLESKPKRQKDR